MKTLSVWVAAALLAAGCSQSKAPSTPVAAWLDAAVALPTLFPKRTGKVTKYVMVLSELGPLVAIRSFEQGGKPWLLAVNPSTLATSVVPGPAAPSTTWLALEAKYPKSPWLRARLDADQHAANLQDAGLTHLLPNEAGVVLTVDLCPSTRKFDLRLIQRLLAVLEPKEKPIPIAFALSGVWSQEHPDELQKLMAMDGTDLTITWMNHSMHHRYSPSAPLVKNFMLEPGTNVAQEVIDTEVLMLESGLTPSVFFRFPGLVSEPTLITFVTELGLIPVGSDAWLAKGEHAKSGSIVLVHGNGNEPRGVDDFLALLDSEKKAISTRQFLLLDLREGLVDEEAGGDH